MKIANLFLLAIVIPTLVACGKEGNDSAELKAKFEELEKKIETLTGDLAVIEMKQQQFSSGIFDPADGKGYQRIDTTSGTFLVSFRDAVPHLDGIKVTLNIGNIQAVSYSGFKLKINYGKRYPKYDPNQTAEQRNANRESYQKSRREKEENFSITLRPATWNTVSVYLPDIKPTDFGQFTLSMSTDSVLMRVN